MVFSHYSLCRHLMYEQLPHIHLKGETLDVGGTRDSDYHTLFGSIGDITNLNASTEHGGGGDIIADCNEPLPLKDSSYDNVISLSTFEHIKNDRLLLQECLRVLRPGGSFHFFTPFLYREHGCPFDYHRHTSQWWEEELQTESVNAETVAVMPLVWDQYATGFSSFEPRNKQLRILLRSLFCLPGLLRGLCGKNNAFQETMALAHYVSGKKG